MSIKRDRIDSDYSDYKEEYAAEVAPQRIDYDYDEKEHKDDVRSSAAGSTAGFIALALSILSLFTFPTLFGLVSVLLGIYAYNRGATVTGGIAAIVGGIAALIAILFRVALIGLLFSSFKEKVSRLCGIPYPVNTSSDGYLIFVLLVALKKIQVLTINPQNITNIIIHFPNADNFAVIPIVNPTVPNAEIVSNSN